MSREAVTVLKDEMKVRQYRSVLFECPDMQQCRITNAETASNNSIVFNLRTPSSGALLSGMVMIKIRFVMTCTNNGNVHNIARAGNSEWNADGVGANCCLQDMFPLACNVIQNLNVSVNGAFVNQRSNLYMKELMSLLYPREVFEQCGDGGGVFSHDTQYRLLSGAGGVPAQDRSACVMDPCRAYNMQSFRRKMLASAALQAQGEGVDADAYQFTAGGAFATRAAGAAVYFTVCEPIHAHCLPGALSYLKAQDFNKSHYYSTFPNCIPLVNDMSVEVQLCGNNIASNLLVLGGVTGINAVSVPTVNVEDAFLQTYWFTPQPSYSLAGVKRVELPIWEATHYTKTCPALAAGATGTVAVDRMNLVSLPSMFIFAIKPNLIKKANQYVDTRIDNDARKNVHLQQSDWSIGINGQIVGIDLTINTSGSALALSGRSHIEID